MPHFAHRSYDKELLDQPNIPFEDIRLNMQELDFINTWLGGHQITIKGVKRLLSSYRNETRPISMLEIGCGGGDNLRAIRNWSTKRKVNCTFTGVDLNPECVQSAKQNGANAGIDFVCSDYRSFTMRTPPDIIFSSLFCHHFTNDDLVSQLVWMKEKASLGFFINDLHRHPLAYYSIKTLTKLFSRSYLVKNDAPLSVLRGFSKTDWLDILRRANLSRAACTWEWAFRWLITYRNNDQ